MSATLRPHHIKQALHSLVDLAVDNRCCELSIHINPKQSEEIKLHAQSNSNLMFATEIERVIDIESETVKAELWDFGLEFIQLITDSDAKK